MLAIASTGIKVDPRTPPWVRTRWSWPISGEVRLPHQKPKHTATEYEVALDFLDILMRPARTRLAAAEFEVAQLRVADEIFALTAEVKAQFYELQASLQVAEMLETIASGSESAVELARRQFEAGNIPELELASREVVFEEGKIVLVDAQAEILEHREHLIRLLGLGGEDPAIKISARLPMLPEDEVPLESIESHAIVSRLDLEAMRREEARLADALGVATGWRWIPGIEVGIGTEHEVEGGDLTGPNLEMELPLFNWGQGEILHLTSALRRHRRLIEAKVIEIRSEVRLARGSLLRARKLATHYRDVVIPLRERIVAEAQKHYNYMLIGVFQLIEAKQDEVDTYREYIETVRDYWIARSELERVAGGSPAGASASEKEE